MSRWALVVNDQHYHGDSVTDNLVEYMCCFCLNHTISDIHPPSQCVHCQVVFCTNCGTALKQDRLRICYNCGSLVPTALPRLISTSSLGCCAVEDNWMRRNRGRHTDGADYFITTGMGEDRGKYWISKRLVVGGSHKYEILRELTGTERELLAQHTTQSTDYCI